MYCQFVLKPISLETLSSDNLVFDLQRLRDVFLQVHYLIIPDVYAGFFQNIKVLGRRVKYKLCGLTLVEDLA